MKSELDEDFKDRLWTKVHIKKRNIMELVNKNKRVIYISGPIRGIPDNNFPAFDKARDTAIELGFDKVISPADMDRDDEESILHLSDKERQRVYAERDLKAILNCTHMAMLENWENSIGATAEYHLAKWIQLEILDAITFKPLIIPICIKPIYNQISTK